ncbi:serine/threonine-protein phosphatase 6 regulatory ankyrin repeat subunit A-like [Haliotis rubra]|uniref:serine/threonine-protein phosphatase 6 regulatory ankyrin repeat subunit A-like n=1 Tax=Haliotis rubra TaxID=36100 RepID=UPI001EE51875|nr:serine/threonine-protein phosphatase 6 regulatory ankyrin repeat subunit A-like [Haliotis rubra]XP_046574031.1 serine/threonine-protein phosphatase 6 regulatory ankyrin repeat subunit A-like [Haliotis rubra]
MMGVRGSSLSWCDVKDSPATSKPTTYCYRISPPSYNHNWTDLHYAASHGNVRRIHEILHKTGTVNLNRKDYYGKTPLYWAAYKGHKNCIEELLKFGAHVNTQCRHGGTPLHAVVSLYPDSALLLIKHGADVNCADNWGVTPMYLAASHGQLEVLHYLVVAGAQLTFKNKSGDIPKQLSCHKDFCAYLCRLSQTPRSLQHLCRATIRDELGDHPQTKVDSFMIPRQLKDYLLLTELS